MNTTAFAESLRKLIVPRVLELTYTAWDLEGFARDCGYDGPPFRWDEERRFMLRCELDAAFFHHAEAVLVINRAGQLDAHGLARRGLQLKIRVAKIFWRVADPCLLPVHRDAERV